MPSTDLPLLHRSRPWTGPVTHLFALAVTAFSLACGTSASPGGGSALLDVAGFGGDGQTLDAGADGSTRGGAGADGQMAEQDGSAAADGSGTGADAGPQDAGAQAPSDAGGGTDAGGAVELDTTGPGCAVACDWDEVCEGAKCVKVVLPCNDQCTSQQYCDPGSNQCADSSCAMPTSFGPSIQKVSEFMIAATSQGCDLDGDKSPDNNLGNLLKVYPAANTELLKAIQNGDFVLLLEAPMYNTNGAAFTITALVGDLDASNLGCSPTSDTANCKYKVDDENYAPAASGTCPPQVVFKPATAKANQLVAGGKGQKFTITLPIMSGLKLTFSQTSIDGQTTGMSAWQSTTTGRICGVITEHDLNKAIEAVPDEGWQQIGLTKSQVKALLPIFMKADIDTNADGVFDAISVAMLFKTVPGQISGIQY